MTKERLLGLDSIRFLMAVWVLLGHYGGPPIMYRFEEKYFFFKVIAAIYHNLFCGPAAVIVFFVISGIVIHYPYTIGKKLSVIEFYGRRYLRICMPMAVIAFIAIKLDKFNSLPFWSLYCELIYYTLYPLLIIGKNKVGWIKLIGFSFFFAYLIVLINSSSPYHGDYHEFGINLTWALGLPCWLLGTYLAEKMVSFSGNKISVMQITALRCVILLFSMACSIARYHLSISYTWSLNIFAIAVFYWLSKEIIFFNQYKTVEILEWGGKWSYSLYLCHPLAPTFLGMLSLNNFFHELNWTFLIIFSLSSSYLFYFFIEKTSHKLARKIRLNNI